MALFKSTVKKMVTKRSPTKLINTVEKSPVKRSLRKFLTEVKETEKPKVLEVPETTESLQVDGCFVYKPDDQKLNQGRLSPPTWASAIADAAFSEGKKFSTYGEKWEFFDAISWYETMISSPNIRYLKIHNLQSPESLKSSSWSIAIDQLSHVNRGEMHPWATYLLLTPNNGCSSFLLQGFGSFYNYATALLEKPQFKSRGFTLDDMIYVMVRKWFGRNGHAGSNVVHLMQAPGPCIEWLHKNGAKTIAEFINPNHTERRDASGRSHVMIMDVRKLCGPHQMNSYVKMPEIVIP